MEGEGRLCLDGVATGMRVLSEWEASAVKRSDLIREKPECGGSSGLVELRKESSKVAGCSTEHRCCQNSRCIGVDEP
jgi:hypothetical protein